LEYEYYGEQFTTQENAMGKNRPFVLIALLLVSAITAFGQSNDQIDVILTQESATVGAAAYLAMSSAGLLADDASFDRAVSAAQDAGLLAAEAAPDDPVTFGQFAYLMMGAHEVSGGLMYLILPGPRYAAREFVYQDWTPVRRGPGDQISGQFMMRVTGRFLESLEATL
jgi:hypothetical protein